MSDAPPRGTYVRPLHVIRAEQRLALARALLVHGAPDYDCLELLLAKQRQTLSPSAARALLRWWAQRGS